MQASMRKSALTAGAVAASITICTAIVTSEVVKFAYRYLRSAGVVFIVLAGGHTANAVFSTPTVATLPVQGMWDVLVISLTLPIFRYIFFPPNDKSSHHGPVFWYRKAREWLEQWAPGR